MGLGGAPAVVIRTGRVQLAGLGRVQDRGDHRRGGVEVGDAVLANLGPDRVAPHLAQAHVGRADGGDGPRGAPAVAMEHRQGPQVDAVLVVPGVHDLGERVQVGAPVGVDGALRLPGGAGRVVDRDRRMLLGDRPGQRVPGGPAEELGVRHDPRVGGQIGPGGFGLAVLGHHQLRHRVEALRGGHRGGQQRGVGDQDLRARMTQDVRHLFRDEPGVHRDQNPARQRHREVGDEHLGQVRHQVGDPVARLDAGRAQRPRHPRGFGFQFGVAEPPPAVDHGGLGGEHPGRPGQERQGG